jgi:hypothetical protein
MVEKDIVSRNMQGLKPCGRSTFGGTTEAVPSHGKSTAQPVNVSGYGNSTGII